MGRDVNRHNSCADRVLTRVEQSESARFRRNEWVSRVAPGLSRGKSKRKNNCLCGLGIRVLRLNGATSASTRAGAG